MPPSYKLKRARFSALLRIQDGAECGNITSEMISIVVAEIPPESRTDDDHSVNPISYGLSDSVAPTGGPLSPP